MHIMILYYSYGDVHVMYKPTCLFIMFNSRRHDMTLIERYVGQSPIAFIRGVAYA